MKPSFTTHFGARPSRFITFLTLLCFSGIILLIGITSTDLVSWAIRTKEDIADAQLFMAGALVLFTLAGLLTIALWKNIRIWSGRK